VIDVKSAIALLLFFVLSACTATEPQQQTEEYNTGEFDIWIGCKAEPLPNGQMSFQAYMGGNPALFEVLLQAIEIMGQKLGVFPTPQDHSSILRLLPYQDLGDDQIY